MDVRGGDEAVRPHERLDHHGLGYLLGAAAELALADGDPESAARLAGASDETVAAIGVHIQADEAEKRARTIAALEETLEAEAFADLHASGRAMPASEALQAARGVVVGGAARRR
jgi:hypothetical protein